MVCDLGPELVFVVNNADCEDVGDDDDDVNAHGRLLDVFRSKVVALIPLPWKTDFKGEGNNEIDPNGLSTLFFAVEIFDEEDEDEEDDNTTTEPAVVVVDDLLATRTPMQ
mgnify:CR=1 FL=1